MTSKEIILNKIRTALKTSSELYADDPGANDRVADGIDSITPQNRNDLWDQFKTELEAISGEFRTVRNIEDAAKIISEHVAEYQYKQIAISGEKYCWRIGELVKGNFSELKIISPEELSFSERKHQFAATELSIAQPLFAVADLGSLVFTYDDTGSSLPLFLSDTTFAVVRTDQIVANQFELFGKIDPEKSKNMVFVAGPSRTADIEKVLVLGAHGPSKLIVLRIEEI